MTETTIILSKLEITVSYEYQEFRKLLFDAELKFDALDRNLAGYSTGYFSEVDGDFHAYVFINEDVIKDWTVEDGMAVLVHEASHVVDFYFDAIRDYNPCSETRAMVMEKVFSYMFKDYLNKLESDDKEKESSKRGILK